MRHFILSWLVALAFPVNANADVVTVETWRGHKVVRIAGEIRDGVADELLAKIEERLPEGPQYYPSDQVTDHPERFIISELIREKALHLTREEIILACKLVLDSARRVLRPRPLRALS